MQLVTREFLEQDPHLPKFLGWIEAPQEVNRIMKDLPMPLVGAQGEPIPALDENKEVLTYEIFRQVVGRDEYPGPQAIGDCVSHGWKRLTDYLAVIQIYLQLKSEFGDMARMDDPDVAERKSALLEEFQEASTEVIYGLSRVEIGGQRGSYSDGSVGAWAAKAVSTYGTISWKALADKGLGGSYDPKRAKEWGAKGIPPELETLSKQHPVKVVSMVKNFRDAAALCQNGYCVAVCSNQGFTMTRDAQGFCRAQGTWNHCMMFSSCRFDRPGLLCHQNWGNNVPDGPRYKNQPTNTFWVDENIVDRMLGQSDSFTGSGFQGYPAQNLLTWTH